MHLLASVHSFRFAPTIGPQLNRETWGLWWDEANEWRSTWISRIQGRHLLMSNANLPGSIFTESFIWEYAFKVEGSDGLLSVATVASDPQVQTSS